MINQCSLVMLINSHSAWDILEKKTPILMHILNRQLLLHSTRNCTFGVRMFFHNERLGFYYFLLMFVTWFNINNPKKKQIKQPNVLICPKSCNNTLTKAIWTDFLNIEYYVNIECILYKYKWQLYRVNYRDYIDGLNYSVIPEA